MLSGVTRWNPFLVALYTSILAAWAASPPWCLTNFCTSCCRYRPVLPVEYIERVLGFACREDALAFLAELNVTFVDDDQASVDCRESLAAVLAC